MKAIVLAATVAITVLPAAAAGHPHDDEAGLTARAEIHESFRLDRGASVEVEGVAGPVTVTTGEGDTATVDIVRMAASQRELDCYRTEVAGGGARLVIRHVQDESRACRNIRSRQEVRLTLPRAVNIAMESIAGSVEIAPIEGRIALSSIAGRVRAEGVRSANLSSIAGGLSISLGALDSSGVDISSIVGPTRIAFGPNTNADVSVSSVMGSIRSTSPNLPISVENGNARARIGAGGPQVSISSIVGLVELSGS